MAYCSVSSETHPLLHELLLNVGLAQPPLEPMDLKAAPPDRCLVCERSPVQTRIHVMHYDEFRMLGWKYCEKCKLQVARSYIPLSQVLATFGHYLVTDTVEKHWKLHGHAGFFRHPKAGWYVTITRDGHRRLHNLEEMEGHTRKGKFWF